MVDVSMARKLSTNQVPTWDADACGLGVGT